MNPIPVIIVSASNPIGTIIGCALLFGVYTIGWNAYNGTANLLDPTRAERLANEEAVRLAPQLAKVEAHRKATGPDSVILPLTLGHYREGDITPQYISSLGGKCVNGGVVVSETYTDGVVSEDQAWLPCK